MTGVQILQRQQHQPQQRHQILRLLLQIEEYLVQVSSDFNIDHV